MSLSRVFSPVLHLDDDDGHPLVGGWLCTYIAGTNTPVATFRDGSGTLNPTQIHLDSRGECEVWLDASVRYKFALYNSTKTKTIWIKDNITAPGVVVMPDTKEVHVVGTTPVVVTAVTLNGITTYTVALDQSFVQQVEDNRLAIAGEITRAQEAESGLNTAITNEVTRATGRENELGTAITNEVTRATAAENAAKTVVQAGNNIQVSRSVAEDGHDIYTVDGVESVPNVQITSPNGTVDVQSTTDVQTNTKTFTVEVNVKPVSFGWFSTGAMPYLNGSLVTELFSKLQTGQENPQGDKIAYSSATQKVTLSAGWYHVDLRYEYKWTGTPKNEVMDVGGTPVDLSYNHSETFSVGTIVQYAQSTNFSISLPVGGVPPQGLEVKCLRAEIYSIQQVMENIVQGLQSVATDGTLTGYGTSGNPLSVVVDNAMDADSENPVQNKVLYGVIGDVESLLEDL